MNDWLHHLPVVWMAPLIFGLTAATSIGFGLLRKS